MRSLLLSLILALSLPAWGAQSTRTSAFEYDPNTGLLVKETIEPDQPQMRLDTTYAHDAFGNRISVTVSSPATGTAAIATRTTMTTYDANGQFPVTISNALGHAETEIFDPRFGTVTSLTGPNGLTTTWQYDGFGRKTREDRADGSFTRWTYDVCDAACPVNGVYRVVTQVYGGGIQTAPATVSYFDQLNRTLRTATQSFNGSWVYKDSVYDEQGRVQKISRPYFAGQPVYWVTSEYDDIGRVVRVYEPDDPDTAALSVEYNGLTVSRTNRKGQITTEVKNSQGQKVSVTDAMGNATTYAYDPFGNLSRTTDPAGNQIVNLYDLRGRKIQTTDPDLGLWKYEYNALGELVKQTDAKTQVTTITYDKLGRMTKRTEPGLTSDWIYDTAIKGKGKLHQAKTSAGYIRTHSYDALGRPSQTQTNLGSGNSLLTSSATYDTAGRAATSTYPSGLVVKQGYNALGYLAEVRNNSTNALYWRADQMDAEGHVTKETYGNGVVTERGYRAENGRLENITGYLGANQIQGHAYVYDTIGNVTIVADGPASQLEIRGGYDNLNRLTQVETYLNGVASTENIAYNALGNITSKTSVGTYAYGDPLHKHAVTAVTGGPVNNSYTYDANGDLTSGAGRSIAWTAWNMPASISSGGQTQSWLYGPEHSRYKFTAPGRTTWYLNPSVHTGGHYERTQYTSGTVEHRHTLYGGGKPIGEVLTFDGGAPSQIRYFHSDQQGSITAVTNEAGVVITRFRYDPWGKQTLVLGSNTGIDQTRQGHTAHEMLDSGLTHMNGRLYDPVLARFVSADPHVDNPFDLQSLNRYSYVNNNPLGFTDPSGYFKLFGKKWSWIRDKVVKPIAQIAICAVTGPGGCAVSASAFALANGATPGQALRAGILNYLTSQAFNIAGDLAPKGLPNVAAHAAVGCVSAAVSGGQCGQGALSAAAGSAWSNYGPDFHSLTANLVAHAVVGGTASVLGGGKFENGAMTASFGYLFNFLAHANQTPQGNYSFGIDLSANGFSGFASDSGAGLLSSLGNWGKIGESLADALSFLSGRGYGTRDLEGLSVKWDAYSRDKELLGIMRNAGVTPTRGIPNLNEDQFRNVLGKFATETTWFTQTYGSTRSIVDRVKATAGGFGLRAR
ncbi:RHS repeat domain-containing protein [Thiobacillus sp.]